MEWIIFDLDGTLIESEHIWEDIRRQFVTEHGGCWREDAQHTMMGMRTAEWAHYTHDRLGVPMTPQKIARDVVDRVAERLSDNVPVLPGADAALERLSQAFRLAVATSSALEVAQTVLRKTGWQPMFAVVVSADEVAKGKPAPDVYLRALELARADPTRTAAVEDSTNGIRSAHAAGLDVIAIPNREYPPDAGALSLASRIATSLDQVSVTMVENMLRR